MYNKVIFTFAFKEWFDLKGAKEKSPTTDLTKLEKTTRK